MNKYITLGGLIGSMGVMIVSVAQILAGGGPMFLISLVASFFLYFKIFSES